MEMDVDLGVIMVKIFTDDFSWSLIMSIAIAINVSRLSGRIPFAANKFLLMPRFSTNQTIFATKTKADK